MYSYLRLRVGLVLDRLGRTVTVSSRSTTGTDGFQNPTDEYTGSETVTAFRTYPNRSTEIRGLEGDRESDTPIFLFRTEDAPQSSDRLEYPEDAATVDNATRTTTYEVGAVTTYDSHVEATAAIVNNP